MHTNPAISANVPPRDVGAGDPNGATRHGVGWPFATGKRPYARLFRDSILLVAIDGSAESAAAAVMADAMATGFGAKPHALSIVDTSPVPIPYPLDIAIGLEGEDAGAMLHRQQVSQLDARIIAALGHTVEWPSSVARGHTADGIANEAARIGAACTVMGLRRHGRVDRVVNDETTLSVMRKSLVPVLGVSAHASGLPRHGLVAMDFSPTSIHAAVVAAQLLAIGGVLTLCYVEPVVVEMDADGEKVLHMLGLDSAFATIERELGTLDLVVNHVVLHHTHGSSPAPMLLEYAADMRIDLLAAGSARHNRLEHFLLGSVSAELVRAGEYSTLIVPPERTP